MLWSVACGDEEYFVVKGDRVHPIPFSSKREAERAADRLNDRDERAASSLPGSGGAESR